MSEETLRVSREDAGDVEVVRVAGEVDMANAEALEAALVATSAPSVALDLTEVSYLDSAGIRAIERGFRRIDTETRAFVMVAPDDSPAGWTLRVAGFDRARIVGTVGEVLAGAGPDTPRA